MNNRHAPRALRLLAAFCAALCALRATAGELLGARFELKPPRPYVGQPFELHLYVDVSPGAEAQDISLQDADFADVASVPNFQTLERARTRRNERACDELHFVAMGRALKPVQRQLAGTLRATVLERRSFGFFSGWSSSVASTPLEPLHLQFRALPKNGAPPDFQGAIGVFTLTARATPEAVAPGDIVNIDYTLAGRGWLGQAKIIFPPDDPNFRAYPPLETQRDENGRLTARRVVVPLNTNAAVIAAARFPYFDPEAGVYREAVAGPLKLRLGAAPTARDAPAVKRVEIAPAAPGVDGGEAAGVGFSLATTRAQTRRLMPFGVALASAVLAAGLLAAWRPRLATVVGVAVFVAALAIIKSALPERPPATARLVVSVPARLCPSTTARVLFHLPAGGQASLLETHEDWLRVEAAGRRGWIPAAALETPPTTGDALQPHP